MFKMLLVEDNLSYRSVLKSALRKRFIEMEILETSSDHETLIAVNTFVPDMIIMDIDLKCEFTGLDLTKIIKAEHPDMVVVILSQHDIPEYRSVAQQNGADFFISKSASLDNIFDYVDSVIERVDRFEPHKQA